MVLEFFFNQSTKRVASGEALPCENYQKQGLSSTDTFNIFWVSSQPIHLLQIRKNGQSKVQNFASEIDIKK